MTVRYRSIVAAIVLACAGPIARVNAQVGATSGAGSRLWSSSNWHDRAAAFTAAAERSRKFVGMRDQLLQQMQREDSVFEHISAANADDYADGYREYRAALVRACLAYCSREGLLQSVLHNARPGAATRTSAVALLGNMLRRNHSSFTHEQKGRMLDAVVAAAADPSDMPSQVAGLAAIEQALGSHLTMSADRRDAVRQAVIANLANSERDLRLEAIDALGRLGDRRDRALLSPIAASDSTTDFRNGIAVYPLREQARLALKRIPQ